MEKMDILYKMIEGLDLTGEEVVNLFTNWHGNQIITDGFIENSLEEHGLNIDDIKHL